ncbi:hypothetical protein B0T25DRAFT_357112 [Lasiosphaeria hispida]|uniref:Methyltransferase domain-containing protein n=1 Tax=Lasiosphaeria hispida TaxID=260671 RepID=A0AAJ0M8T3_9PEZI|nr:hypothetical protein B0T25DRAFT_357112 [Lasiosphaeria hispida]
MTLNQTDVLHKNGVAYALDRSYSASGRLALQHQLWKEVTVKPILPRILACLRSPKGGSADAASADAAAEVNIADVGTGTGIWAVDIARGLSTQEVKFKVHGFDISDAQFPPAHALPAGVQLSVADALAPPAEELCGAFDFVHVAQFAGVRALGEDPSPVMDHAMALLKPGGWIQWDEWAQDGKGKIEILSQGPSPRCDAALALTAKVLPQWVLDVPGHLTKCGFLEAGRHDFIPPSHLLPQLTSLWYMTADEIIQCGFEEPTRSALMEALAGAYAETRDKAIGAMFKTCPSSNIGQKPNIA